MKRFFTARQIFYVLQISFLHYFPRNVGKYFHDLCELHDFTFLFIIEMNFYPLTLPPHPPKKPLKTLTAFNNYVVHL